MRPTFTWLRAIGGNRPSPIARPGHPTGGTPRLENGWTRRAERYTGGPLREPATYARKTSFGFVALWERVDLDGDLQHAHVHMRRWIIMQLLKL